MLMRTYRGEERLLGEIVQFHQDARGWRFIFPRCEITVNPKLRFPDRVVARVTAMSMLFLEAITEECTAVSVEVADPDPPDLPPGSGRGQQPPSQGSDGGC